MFASVHKMYAAHLTCSFFSVTYEGSAFHMIHIIHLWGFASTHMIRCIEVLCTFLFVLLYDQQTVSFSRLVSKHAGFHIICSINLTDWQCFYNHNYIYQIIDINFMPPCLCFHLLKCEVFVCGTLQRSNHKVSCNNIKRKRQILFCSSFLAFIRILNILLLLITEAHVWSQESVVDKVALRQAFLQAHPITLSKRLPSYQYMSLNFYKFGIKSETS